MSEGPSEVFAHATWRYRGDAGEEARLFRAGEAVPPASEGWRDHPNKEQADAG